MRLGYNKMRKNNFLSSMVDQAQSRAFWKKKTKAATLDSKLPNAIQNPVYRALKNQRDGKAIFTFILGSAGIQPEPSTHTRSKSYQLPRYSRSEGRWSKCESKRERECFREKAAQIMVRTKRMSAEMESSKKRMGILDKYSRKVESYYRGVPTEKGEDETSDISFEQEGNEDELDVFKHSFRQRASECIKYKEPKIPPEKLRKLKVRVKVRLNLNPTFKRLLTLNSS